MKDPSRTHPELIEEISFLKQRIKELEQLESECKQAEEELRKSEERYRRLVENASEVIYSLSAEDGTITSLNPAFERITGWSRAEWLGKPFMPLVHPDDLGLAVETFQQVLRGEVIQPCELRILSRSGEYISGEFTSVPNIEKGKVIGEFGIARDITERKRAEEALCQSEEKYRNIFNDAILGIYQTTPEGRILNANPALARMCGYDTPEELINNVTATQMYVNPEDREIVKGILSKEGVMEKFEVPFRKTPTSESGEIIWVSINARCVHDEHGVPMYYEGTFEDITERKLAEESLEQTMEKLRKFLVGTIRAMSSMVETRDPYTAGHQRRVSSLARVIAQEMGLSNDTVDTIRMAGIIHDIGKISVPAEILVKPGKITDIEMSLIRVHSQTGYDILKNVDLPYPIAEIVLQHHERLDGSGYPQGLKNGEILLETHILAVADVVEAITSHRPYRLGFGIDVALQEIEKNKGILYDEKVVEACIKLFQEKQFSFEC